MNVFKNFYEADSTTTKSKQFSCKSEIQSYRNILMRFTAPILKRYIFIVWKKFNEFFNYLPEYTLIYSHVPRLYRPKLETVQETNEGFKITLR